MDNLVKKIQEKVASNELVDAVSLLQGTHLRKEALLQKRRLSEIHNKELKGIISAEEASRQRNEIGFTILQSLSKLEDPPYKGKRNFLFAIPVGIAVLALLGYWGMQLFSKEVPCEPNGTVIAVADFSEEKVFTKRVITNLKKELRGRKDILTEGTGFQIDYSLDDQMEREIARIQEEKCIDKGLITYGSYEEFGNEQLMDCHIRLIHMDINREGIEKASQDEIILTDEIKNPDQINFFVSDQALLLSDFLTGLLYYYENDPRAEQFFAKILQIAEKKEVEDIKAEVNFYVGNIATQNDEPEKAEEAYAQAIALKKMSPEIYFNMSLAQIKMGRIDKAVKSLGAYTQSFAVLGKPVPKKDSIFVEVLEEVAQKIQRGEITQEEIPSTEQLFAQAAEIEKRESLPEPSPTHLEVENERLSIIVKQVGAHHGLRLHVPKQLMRKRYSLRIPLDTLEKGLDMIAKATGTTYETQGNTAYAFVLPPPKEISEKKPQVVSPNLTEELSRGNEAPTEEQVVEEATLQQAEEQKPEPPVSNPGIPKPVMVSIPAGSFTMGCTTEQKDCDSDEKPTFQVSLNRFYMGQYEVTFTEYDRFWQATNGKEPADEDWGRGDRPVINVSWYDAVAYCNWLSKQHGYEPVYTINGTSVTANWGAKGYRLPTEAEWEYAAREGGKAVLFGNGKNHLSPNEVNFDASQSYKKPYSDTGTYRRKTVPVGSLNSPNSLKLHDMSGNVWEWCWDWKASYTTSSKSHPKGPSTGSSRVLRGGSWNNVPRNCRVAYRSNGTPSLRDGDIGFRLSRTP